MGKLGNMNISKLNFYFAQSLRYSFSLLFNVRKALCNYGNLQAHFTQVWREGGRGRENGEEMLFSVADFSQLLNPTKTKHEFS